MQMFILNLSLSGVSYLPKKNQIVYSTPFPVWNFISPYKKVKMFILYLSLSRVSYLPTNKSNCLFYTIPNLKFHISLQKCQNVYSIPLPGWSFISSYAGLGGSFGCAVQLETRRSRVQPQPRSATFFRGDLS